MDELRHILYRYKFILAFHQLRGRGRLQSVIFPSDNVALMQSIFASEPTQNFFRKSRATRLQLAESKKIQRFDAYPNMYVESSTRAVFRSASPFKLNPED